MTLNASAILKFTHTQRVYSKFAKGFYIIGF